MLANVVKTMSTVDEVLAEWIFDDFRLVVVVLVGTTKFDLLKKEAFFTGYHPKRTDQNAINFKFILITFDLRGRWRPLAAVSDLNRQNSR